MISTMYCATCVQVTARMPPSIEHSRMPTRPNHTPTSNGTCSARAAMVPVAEWLALPEREAAERVPFVLAVDASDRLHRVIIDLRLVQATRRCVLLWHRLQEHGGIHNSHAERALASERAAWEEQKQQELEALKQTATGAARAGAAATAPAAESSVAPAAAAAAAPAGSEAETAPPPSRQTRGGHHA